MAKQEVTGSLELAKLHESVGLTSNEIRNEPTALGARRQSRSVRQRTIERRHRVQQRTALTPLLVQMRRVRNRFDRIVAPAVVVGEAIAYVLKSAYMLLLESFTPCQCMARRSSTGRDS